MKQNIIIMGLLLLFAGCKSMAPVAESDAEEPREPASHIEQLESTARTIEAGKQEMLGNTANAIVLYAEAASIDPDNSAALYKLARLHAQRGYLQDAEEYALKAVELDPHNKHFNKVLAEIYFIQEKNDEGLAVQQMIASKYPNDMSLQISLLGSLLYLNMLEEGVEVLERIEQASGFNNELSVKKQRLLMEMDRPDLALEEAKRLVSHFPADLIYLEMLADLYMENDKPGEAYDIYRRMLDIRPGHPLALLLLSDYYREAGEAEKSFGYLKEAFQSEQLDIDGKARIMVSYYFMSENDTTYARQAYVLSEIMVNIHPDEAEAHAIYGDFLIRDEELELARERYLRAAELEPSELGFWQQVLSLDLRLSEYESMLENSDRALEYFFEQPILYFFNGLAHYYLKNYSEAISVFNYGKDMAFGEDELLGQFHTLLGDAYFRTEEYDQAFRSYEQALQINPDDPYALNNYSYYMSKRNKDLDKALVMSTRSLELEPDNAAFQDTYGWIKYKLGDYQEARKWIRKSLDNSEEPSAVVLEHYGDVLYKLGEKEEALQYWEKALTARDENEEHDDTSDFLNQKVEEGTLFE